jgi:prepilin-type N-terminal cleavage/methylation domain-containing protein
MKIKQINKQNKRQKGFTLIEILVVIGIIGILATVVLVAVNPSRQFKQARDSQRIANVNTILNAIGQNIADHEGNFFCDGAIRTLAVSAYLIRSGEGSFDIAECLVPDYLPKLPYDPKSETAHYTNEDDYDTGYQLRVGEDGRLTVVARSEVDTDQEIAVTR